MLRHRQLWQSGSEKTVSYASVVLYVVSWLIYLERPRQNE